MPHFSVTKCRPVLHLWWLTILSLSWVGCTGATESSGSHGAEHTEQSEPNALIDETSPYLLQHADNPVNWYPWGDEAFEKAKRENKPIFLSVGYSTCYWCHVMEKESFEDPEVAEIMNEHYVSIKVDRENRPDVDKQYMLATRLMTGRGGWPNSVWLTPDGKPWMAGTYFPKKQFMKVLRRMADFWENRRSDVNAQADKLAKSVRDAAEGRLEQAPSVKLSRKLVAEGVRQLLERFDSEHGGFGQAPKFPPHGTLRLLMAWVETKDEKSDWAPVTMTLDAMWLGGVRDHLGGGFHRYSTDEKWKLPHFEKMLYDNAQLLRLYAEAASKTNRAHYRQAAQAIVDWLAREMTAEGGAFYSAINSGEVGEEGAFYLWTMQELQDVLGAEKAKRFADIYHFKKEGNFREESTGERTGENILHLQAPIAEIAQERKLRPKQLRQELASMREKLFQARMKRPYPHKDDKILTAWNGLMIEALAYAGRVLDQPKWIKKAKAAADFILANMWSGDGLMRSYREGKVQQKGFLDDHAHLMAGLLELHHTTDKDRWLDAARRLGDTLLAEFYDEKQGGFFLVSNQKKTQLFRSKALSGGGNLPSANGVAALALMRLSSTTGKERYARAARETLKALAPLAARRPFSQEYIMLALLQMLENNDNQSAKKDKELGVGTTNSTENRSDTSTNASTKEKGGASSATAGDPSQKPEIKKRTGPVAFRMSVPQKTFTPGETVTVQLELAIDKGWHLYGENPDVEFVLPVKLDPVPLPRLEAGEVRAPKPKSKHDPILDKTVNVYEGKQQFAVPFKIKPDASSGEAVLALKVRTQACNDKRCLSPEDTTLSLPITIAAD